MMPFNYGAQDTTGKPSALSHHLTLEHIFIVPVYMIPSSFVIIIYLYTYAYTATALQLILYSLYVTNCGDFSIYIIPGIIRAMYGLLLEDWKGTFAITLPLSKDLAAADNGAHEQAATCISLSKPRLNTWGVSPIACLCTT